MNTNRDIAILVGVLYLLATFTAILGFALYQPILIDPESYTRTLYYFE